MLIMNNLASVLRCREKYEEAESLMRRALVGKKQIPASVTMMRTQPLSSKLVAPIRGKSANIPFNPDLDTRRDLKEEREGKDHGNGSDEELETNELDGEMTSPMFGSNLDTVSSDSESSSSTSGEHKITAASRPRTKVGRSQNTFIGYTKSKRHKLKRKLSATSFLQPETGREPREY
ncbi:hypothetical protein LTR10_017082 [Elasticomyces elasticus]|nr:hypothetical protein LTR10_017082 [Elasticomyces elasticus]KAK5037200.1 hypothetical protein LTR13_005005 [Exophiala sideris]KAK5182358.1 hypothetical protein LTR44_005369 [Eurotiomycetes sp. CCFEE 6388]